MKTTITLILFLCCLMTAQAQHVTATNGPAGESTLMMMATNSGPIVQALPPLPIKEEPNLEPPRKQIYAPTIPRNPAPDRDSIDISYPTQTYLPSPASGNSRYTGYTGPKTVQVKGHMRDGSYVAPHTRSAPGSRAGKR
jgi:hypothetical protein